ncbi:TonB-dependent receptor [Qipengyuania gelatinilytica]|uniref:TonB-dependent receptor n=1 Tax=Qipengyuania gelatinilytica TaxID=2867231 RepID=A0ABX9A740_9SPHN|nr:TonB-dependent receptor [Qipengyuania gelatinilytica]QZD96124.1 TonB-dependent receptor [Qipengyuania gelatinilytica]
MSRKSNTVAHYARRIAALTTASGLALVAAQPAFAQDVQEDEDAETVVEDDNVIIVSGFRQSLESAQDFKENADTVVDVITAEDIGALPDRSVAEALQRVPGVNISRFEQRDDPDRFSVEGSNVIIRGLPYTLSNLNGREVFSANGGRVLQFNDISPELLGRVEVYKNVSADMIDGNISGLVNLVTRKPLDTPGLRVAGTVEANVGDLAEEWSPGFSGLISNTWDSNIGTFGLQFGYAQQELVSRTDASQVTDPCYRADTLDGPCFRIVNVGSGGYFGDPNFDETNFPPAGSVVVPKGAGVRTTTLERDRQAYSGVAQWEASDGSALITLEYLRAETQANINEFSALALVNDDGLFPVPVDTWTFDNGIFQSGTLTQLQPFTGGQGIPTELLRFQREDDAATEDFSIDIDLFPTDRLALNIEVQHTNSDRTENGFIGAMQTYTNVSIDNTGDTPQVTFLEPGTGTSPTSYFNDPARTFYWFLLDNQVKNDGNLTSMRFDADYNVSDDGFLRDVKFGARWGDRERTTRNANFSNWGNLGAPWTGRGGNWNCGDFQAFGCGGAYVFDFPESSNLYNPFGDNFQRGNAPIPFGDGSAYFFGGDNLVADYLSGDITQQANEITAFTLTPNAWFPISARGGTVPGGPWLPGEISDVEESTDAYYLRADFGTVFGNGWELSGNAGVRYVTTTVRSEGELNFPFPDFFDFDNDGQVTVAEINDACANVQPGQQAPAYCDLSDARKAEFASAFTGETIDDSANINFDNWLPAANVKLDVGGGLLFRVAVSKGISRPDLAEFRTGGAIFDNTRALQLANSLEEGPLFAIFTGNRNLRPIESWNYDFSIEYYFDDVGSITAALFQKDFSELFGFGPSFRTITSPSGATADVQVNGPINFGEAQLRGVELAYQDVFEFLPGPLDGLGTALTYTYIDSKDFSSGGDVFGDLPQPGVSKHTVNATLFYEKGPISARTAYNWRSEYLQTPRDVIFPFSPIYGEATGQLDASLFFSVTEDIKLGVQGVNLLDEVTRTSQVIDFDGNRVTRSAFRNDRRFTFLARFDF